MLPGFPRAGEAVLCKTNVFFRIFSRSPIFNLVTANDRYRNSPGVFFILFLRPPIGVLSPI